jgi:ankyrin repeat protein
MKTEQMIGSFFRDILDQLDENGKTDLEKIIRQKNPQLVENFIEEHNVGHFLRDAHGNTLLHLFMGSLFPKNIDDLLNKRLDVNAVNYNGDTPLHFGCTTYCIENLTKLLENGANLHATNKLGETCLHIAARYGRLDLIAFLIEQGINVNAVNIQGKTALDVTIEAEQYEVSAELVKVA